MLITSKKMPSQLSMSEIYKKKFTVPWIMLPCATLFGIEHLCYLLHLMTVEGKARLTIIFSPLNHVQCLRPFRLLLQNTRVWVVYTQHYLSQF